ncbi:MAG: caspase family protein [Verrucomicrobiota bacterium]|nr:caspase family protein [Verrucomicrobiota bacterium]
MPENPSNNQTSPAGLRPVRVVAAGVSAYPAKSGFPALKTCSNNAAEVRAAFRDIHQLAGKKDHLVLMVADSAETPPSRGMILDQLEELVADTVEADRLLFYFSGHGHTLEGIEDFFLVPQDAFSATKADSLLSLRAIITLLRTSKAGQITLILDTCTSGPTLGAKPTVIGKAVPDFLGAFLGVNANTAPLHLLVSRSPDETAHTKSDNPKLGLFALQLLKGLRGDPQAMDGLALTIPSLFHAVATSVIGKCPAYRVQHTPDRLEVPLPALMLADFRKPILINSRINLNAHPLEALIFRQSQVERTKCILTEWKDSSKTPQQLEYAANTDRALSTYLADDFNRWRPLLRKQFGFSPANIDCSGGTLTFPGGLLSTRFEARDKKHGHIHRELRIDIDWFGDGPRLSNLLEALDFRPESFAFQLTGTCQPLHQITGLEANQWEVKSESDIEVTAHREGITLIIGPDMLSFEGFDIPQLLTGADEPTEGQRLLLETLAFLAPVKG